MGADIGTVWWSAGQNSSPGCYYFLCKFVYVEFILYLDILFIYLIHDKTERWAPELPSIPQ